MIGPGDSKTIPTIRIFPDFGEFTHTIVYPNDYWQSPEKYPTQHALLPGHLHAKLVNWEREFEKCASADCYWRDHGAMLWISFDLAGIGIAKQIKTHVGDRARVLYLKPIESPYYKYETAREVVATGKLVTLNYPVGWHNLPFSPSAAE